MRIPETVKIGPITYHVVELDNLSGDHIGEHRNSTAELRVKRDLPDDVKEATFWHEVLHGMCEVYCQKHNERMIDAIAHGLMMLFEANRWRLEIE